MVQVVVSQTMLVRPASNPVMHLAAPGLKPISRLEMIAVMGYSPASTKEELVHQSMNLLQCLWEAQSRYRCEVRALTQSAMQDMGLKRHFPGNRGSHCASNPAKFLHQQDQSRSIE